MNLDFLTWTLVLLLGLAIGSFLNVVIHRLPRMLAAQWDCEVAAASATPRDAQTGPQNRYNIAVPGSQCPQCGHALSWKENLPVISFVVLKGRCQQCHAPIGWRYPTVEILSAAVFVWSFSQYGLSVQALVWAGFGAALIALAAIDADTTLLPDAITQPLVWAGLLAANWGLSPVGLSNALWGAVAGYVFLWSVHGLFLLITGKEGMGQGDFKLLAALGAWLGWEALLSLVLMASLTGVAYGLWLRARQRLAANGQMPFGPFLALAGAWVMVWGPLPFTRV